MVSSNRVIRRPTVAGSIFKSGAAAERLSARATAKNTRMSSQFIGITFAFLQNDFDKPSLLPIKTQDYSAVNSDQTP